MFILNHSMEKTAVSANQWYQYPEAKLREIESCITKIFLHFAPQHRSSTISTIKVDVISSIVVALQNAKKYTPF